MSLRISGKFTYIPDVKYRWDVKNSRFLTDIWLGLYVEKDKINRWCSFQWKVNRKQCTFCRSMLQPLIFRDLQMSRERHLEKYNIRYVTYKADTMIESHTQTRASAVIFKYGNVRDTSWPLQNTPCAKNLTRVILNILYSCKSAALKFSTWYPAGPSD